MKQIGVWMGMVLVVLCIVACGPKKGKDTSTDAVGGDSTGDVAALRKQIETLQKQSEDLRKKLAEQPPRRESTTRAPTAGAVVKSYTETKRISGSTTNEDRDVPKISTVQIKTNEEQFKERQDAFNKATKTKVLDALKEGSYQTDFLVGATKGLVYVFGQPELKVIMTKLVKMDKETRTSDGRKVTLWHAEGYFLSISAANFNQDVGNVREFGLLVVENAPAALVVGAFGESGSVNIEAAEMPKLGGKAEEKEMVIRMNGRMGAENAALYWVQL